MLTRKEKQKKLLEALDLRVGDILDLKCFPKYKGYKIIEENDKYALLNIETNTKAHIDYIIIYDYQVLEFHQKTYGEYKCGEVNCIHCPLYNFNCGNDSRKDNLTLYDILNFDKDDEDYNYFKGKLDRIVEDESEILEDDK